MLGSNLPTETVSQRSKQRPRPIEPEGPGAERADGGGRDGCSRERLTRASRADLEDEIEQLDQELSAYETREQQVIDRYERLLAEQRRREREESARATATERSKVTRLKYRILRTLGLR